jgi:Mlc titration factor MtfA (ptsG expression regulator)
MWRRRRLLAAPFPQEWERILAANLPFYTRLTLEERTRLCDDLRIFVAETSWEGCGGLVLTDEIRITIAAQACLLTLNLEGVDFSHVKTILVYPDEYFAEGEPAVGEDGTIYEDVDGRAGEAWYGGPVVLSWADANFGARNPSDGVNVILHEFAHQLDMLDGVVNGTPPLANRSIEARWTEVMTAEFKRLRDMSKRGRATLLDDYGAVDPGEFFAVCTECFFELPVAFRRRHAELYALLCEYYRQDPAARLGRGA